MRTVTLPDGSTAPALGLGTWKMGESRAERAGEVAALRAGLDLGLSLIDTAEMYGEGGAEEVVGEAIAGRRDEVFLVSKVYPHNAGAKSAVAACERSLTRLKTDRLDLYLLHWRGSIPLAETVEAFERLAKAGKIRRWGVSNFDAGDIAELAALDKPRHCSANQVLYHPGQRGIEWELIKACAARAMPVMAYSPLGQGHILANKALVAIAQRHGVSASALAVAWTMRHPNVIAIPKSSHAPRVREFAAARDLALTAADLAEIDAAFPPPRGAKPLAML